MKRSRVLPPPRPRPLRLRRRRRRGTATMDALSLIDVSGEEDDFLLDLASPPQHPDPPAPPRPAPAASAVAADSERPAAGSPPPPPAGQAVDLAEQAPERAQSPKKAKPKGGVNLRKSLAWDNAFFTSEVESSKVSDHEAHVQETGLLVAMDIAEEEGIPALHENAQANGEVQSLTVELSSCTSGQQESETTSAPCEDSSPSQIKVSPSLPLGVAATMEVELLEVIDHATEAPRVSEHGAQMLETGPLVAMDIAEEEGIPALNQNVQANGDISSSIVELSLCASSQQQSETTTTPCEESVSSQTKLSPSLPLGGAKMEVEPVNVIENEAVLAAMDIAKENIPAVDTGKENVQPGGFSSPLKENILASHQNIQPKEHMTPVKGSIVASHTNAQAVGEMTPVSLLSQKLSSISLGQANGEATPLTHKPSPISQGQSNGEATPLTLLAQKLSSISLGDATD